MSNYRNFFVSFVCIMAGLMISSQPSFAATPFGKFVNENFRCYWYSYDACVDKCADQFQLCLDIHGIDFGSLFTPLSECLDTCPAGDASCKGTCYQDWGSGQDAQEYLECVEAASECNVKCLKKWCEPILDFSDTEASSSVAATPPAEWS